MLRNCAYTCVHDAYTYSRWKLYPNSTIILWSEHKRKTSTSSTTTKTVNNRTLFTKDLSRHIRHEKRFSMAKMVQSVVLPLICDSAQLDKMPHAHYDITSFCWEDAHLWHPLRFFCVCEDTHNGVCYIQPKSKGKKWTEKTETHSMLPYHLFTARVTALFTPQLFRILLLLFLLLFTLHVTYILLSVYALSRWDAHFMRFTRNECVVFFFTWQLLLLCKFDKQNKLKAKQTMSNERKCACLFVCWVDFYFVLCEMWDTYSCMRDHHVAGAVVALLPDFVQPIFWLWIVCECLNHGGCVGLYGCGAALHSVW